MHAPLLIIFLYVEGYKCIGDQGSMRYGEGCEPKTEGIGEKS
jgi:hypothetical protein